MINLSNGCKCSAFTVFPKNWQSKSAKTTKDWYIKYRFYHPEYPQPKQVMVKGMNHFKQLYQRQEATKTALSQELDKLLNQAFNPFIKPNTAVVGSPAITASAVLCYHPGYTLVEKLQTIVNKYRKELEATDKPKNFMRQFYDVYCLLKHQEVRKFIGSPEYEKHKVARFRGADKLIPLPEQPALLIPDEIMRKNFETRYKNSSKLY